MAALTALEALLLGLLQGMTEWLPVSSSGHLVIAQHVLGVPNIDPAFDLLLHLGTLAAVLLAYRARIAAMAVAVFTWPRDARPQGAHGDWKAAWAASEDRRLAAYVVLATIPAGVAGVILQEQVEASFHSLTIVAFGLMATGLLLASTRWAKPRADGALRFSDAMLIGVAQSFSLFRGFSRSGATISAALWLGVDRRKAADFSFLLSIPLFVGATVLQWDSMADLPKLGWTPVAIGFFVSFAVGYTTLRLLVGYVARKGVALFSVYCIALSIGLFAAILRP